MADAPVVTSPLRLNLGACDDHKPGFLSVDRTPPADVVTDLSEPWPWPDSSVAEIYAKDVFEHLGNGYRLKKTFHTACVPLQNFAGASTQTCTMLQDVELVPFYGLIHAMNEAHRVLVPNGKLELIVPCWPGIGPVVDPTHAWPGWCSDTRYYFDERWNDPKTGERGRLGPGMGITALFRTVGGRSGKDWEPIRYADDAPERRKLFLILEAVK